MNLFQFKKQTVHYLKSELFRIIAANICLGIAYGIGAKFSLSIASLNGVAAIWIPSGMTLAAYLLFGSKIFPAIIFGSVMGVADLYYKQSLINFLLLNISCILGNCLQPLLATSIINRYTNIKALFVNIEGIIVFILSAFFSPIISATIIVGISVYTGFYTLENSSVSFFTIWIASGLTHLIFTPVFLINKIHSIPGKNPINSKIKLSIIFLVTTGNILIFWLTFFKNNSVEYIFLLLLILTIFTLGKRFSIMMVAIVSSAAVIATTFELGPFVKESTNQSLLLLQSFIGVFSITSLILSAIIDEKQKATNKLELTLANLENTVEERTLQLAKAKEKAELANQAKSTFIANMSHELRSPLNGIIGFSQLMLRANNLPPDQYENAGIIYRSGEYLLTLINHILDLSKIEAGKANLNLNDFDLDRLLDDLEDMLHLRASNEGLNLIFQKDANIPRYICTDEVKLRQVLINLISNAIKFTPKGKITVNVTRKNAEITDILILDFQVCDTGVGIAPAELPKIFEAFSQAQAGTQMQEGTGLGLAISRKFVQLMGGDIFVDSELGKGTTFQFFIEVKLGQEINNNSGQERSQVLAILPGQPTYKVLTVDDKPINRQLLFKLLAPLGFDMREASNGQEAITIWDEWEPHLIWMDMRMPVMDGYEATKYIKSTTKGNATAIIALTASVLEEEKAIVLSAGCDDFLRKPFAEHTIFDALAKHLGVKYIYAEDNSENLNPVQKESLTSHSFTCMDEKWISKFYEAALEANTNLVLELVQEIPETETFLIQALTKFVKQFEFEKLVDLIEPLLSND